ncbi:exodeoxyribonuclease III [Candidatus Comchoanobacter bicostacola]|uniref:Exodeoxyribonuclease III n=1 Tax=Candidatus Comchoanobacter bicostacola TaxID=2919598 RepID=A0ABY5DK56_9GAMM|nr:exodeoxyribonuclease III [Candidatus Comchoanobacter bicostacola]UTC24368.1 exodeoxyribonuclease III [Candidatus Comchoanobacter bicostacola]
MNNQKITTLNLNGIRSAQSKGLQDWVEKYDPDIICVQETKAQIEKLLPEQYTLPGYFHTFSCAEKPGYSGVGIYSKVKPKNTIHTCGLGWADREGRFILAEFAHINTKVVSLYLPSGTSGAHRQDLKYEMMDYLYQNHLSDWIANNESVIICGDWNIAHTPMDIKRAKQNEKNSGYLPEERAWLSQVLKLGYIDTFRACNPDDEVYSWWSFRGQARKNNVGWRIDYQIATPALKDHIISSSIDKDPLLSDHGPIRNEYHIDVITDTVSTI